ncbi:hypothetical protein ALI22I_20425 [Saccharothrix sp. ALI-22-I]|uniref:hypothetical protein n=1 Tax=Saccharothrix sp. ALI-22-I TaxID=1933778 RepID=UPI00097BFFC0|nr:hypothetical protein [Saccharothrix sp. ALI-22-I]ONI88107.1 hypothetical protein ALI22I_20425 [Saccharothrix sp. ALI-22-I]
MALVTAVGGPGDPSAAPFPRFPDLRKGGRITMSKPYWAGHIRCLQQLGRICRRWPTRLMAGQHDLRPGPTVHRHQIQEVTVPLT